MLLINLRSDRCVIATVRQTKTQDHELFLKEILDISVIFLHDLCDWNKISLINYVELAWKYFHDAFINIINKHAPFCEKVKRLK